LRELVRAFRAFKGIRCESQMPQLLSEQMSLELISKSSN